MNYLSKENVQGILELTLLQKQIEQEEKSSSEEGGRLLQATCLLTSQATAAQVQTAWDALIAAHPQLRSIFRNLRNQTVQVVLKQRPVPIEFRDLRAQTDEEQQQAVESALAEQRAPFVLGEGPLLRGTYLQMKDGQSVLVLSWHEMLFDTQSAEHVVADLRSLLQAVETGAALPSLTRQPFQTYVDWLGTTDWTAAQAYWQEELATFEAATALPVDARAAERTVTHDALLEASLSTQVTEGLAGTASQYGLEPSLLAQAAWGVLLGVYSGTDTVSFGLHVEGRPAQVAGAATMIAPLANLLPLVLTVDGGQTVEAYLQQVQQKVANLQRHSFLSLDEIKGYHNLPPQMDVFGSTFAVAPSAQAGVEFKGQTFNHPLTVRITAGDEWKVAFAYASEQFAEETVQGLLNTYVTLLESIASNEAGTIAQWNLLSADEREKLFHTFNRTTLPAPDLSRLAHQVIEAQVAQTPDAVAVTCLGVSLTYRELNERANQLAHWLRSEGFGRNDLAALFAERSIDMLVAILAIFKAGGAYVPLDPAHPDSRIRTILESAGATVIFTETALAARSMQLADDLPAAPIVFCLQPAPSDAPVSDVTNLVVYGTDNLAFENESDDLANVFFTSGSTGLPKGAMIEHIGMLNHLYAKINLLGLNADSVVAQNASHCFDISVWQFLAPLMVGGQVAIYPHEQVAADPAALFRAVQEDQVTVLEMVPAVIEMFLAESDNVRGYHELPWLEYMISTGEGLPVSLCQKWLQTYAHTKVVNTYGATECSDDTSHEVIDTLPDEEQSHIVLGTPIPNFRTYVLDRWQRPVPIGCAGEIYLTGVGVGKGYLNDPERTAHAFLTNPFDDGTGTRMYRTGDLGKYLPNGQLVFISRVDHQVKVRGHRIELGEIESALLRHPAVRQAAAIVRPDAEGQNRILAYVVLESAVETSALRDALAQAVPPYMMPEQLIVLDKMPLNRNDKIDRKALPEPTAADEQRTVSAPPRTETERVLVEIWQEVLGVSQIGIDDNFFSLGGHSLRTIQVRSRLKQTFGLDVSLRTLFDRLTIRELASFIDGQQENGGAEQGIPRFPEAEHYPMSHAQQRLYFIHKMDTASCSYNMPTYVELTGELQLDAVQRAVETVVARHEALRTTFGLVDGEPVQRIMPAAHFAYAVEDLSDLSVAEQAAAQEQQQLADLTTPFDLEKGPVFRVKVLKLAQDRHVLLANLHHIVSDFWSWDLFFQEFFALYRAYSQGQDNPLPELPIQYRDYSMWQNQRLENGEFADMEQYWQTQLGGELPVLDLPTDAPRTSTPSQEAASHAVIVDAGLVEKIDQLAKQQDATQFMILGAAVSAFLARMSGQEDIILGTPEAGRNRMELEGLIGFFINTLPLRMRLDGEPTFTELLEQAKKTALDAYANHEYPFNRMVDLVKWDRDTSRTPIFSVMFQVIPQNLEAPESDIGVTWLPSGVETTNFDLNIAFVQRDHGLECSFGYRRELFREETIARWMGHFVTFLQRVIDAPALPFTSHSLLTEAELQDMVAGLVGETVVATSDLCVHERFEQQVAQTPDAIAVFYEGEQLTYRELNERANQVAHVLRKQGVGTDVLVGLCMERSVHLVVGLLGVLKAGGAYVPLDPTHPQERLTYLLNDSQVKILLTMESLLDRFAADATQSLTCMCLDRDSAQFDSESTENVALVAKSDQSAYVIYTSGSTGQPKGVLIEHRSISNLALGLQRAVFEKLTMPQTAPMRVSLNAPITFDCSIQQLQMLMSGHALYILPDEVRRDAGAMLSYLRTHQLDFLDCTPSQLHMLFAQGLLAEGERVPQVVLVGGEAIDEALWKQMAEQERIQFFNVYGPTECTVDSTVAAVTSAAIRPNIGRPIANAHVYVVDRHLQPVTIGVPGELCIGGKGLARGYLNRPELTAEKFIAHPFAKTAGERLYRTGDLVRYLADGTIEFLGRIDDQVKVRGYRIELGEIEHALLQQPAVREAIVLARKDATGDQSLVAYVVLSEEADAAGAATVSVSDIRSALKGRLPEYMVPTSVMILDQLPLTANGKVDRRALPAPDMQRQLADEFVAPRNATESAVAKIWSEVLGVEQIGVHDNFFEIGGHSLKAMAMIDQIKRKLGISLPIPALFRAPTVALLSQELHSATREAERCLVPLHTGAHAAQAPLFLVHPQGGGVLSYLELAQELGAYGNVYGLQAVGYDSDATPLDTVERMATRYLSEMRTVAPQGPYCLAGWSFGGNVAYEMALQLEAQGEQVAFLGMLDVHEFHAIESGYEDVTEENVLNYYAELAGLPSSDIAGLSEEEALAMIGRHAQARNMFHGEVTPEEVRRKMRLMLTCGIAHARYTPSRQVQADIHLFRVNEVPPEEARELVDAERWTQHTTGKLAVVSVEGHHHNMVRPPYVASLAEQIRHALAGAAEVLQATTHR